MMMRIVFWNVENLFHWRVNHGRLTAPRSQDEYISKVDAVTQVIRHIFPGHLPDALGLAEVGDADVFHTLLNRFGTEYAGIWVGSGTETNPGLGFAYRHSEYTATELAVYPDRQAITEDRLRPRYLAVDLEVKASGLSFLIVVNHWKSNLGAVDEVNKDRVETARSLGDLLADQSTARSRPVIVMGDFNADPFDGIFDEQRLRARRSYSTMRWWRNSMATLYNPCWRFLPPAVPYPDGAEEGFLEGQPQTSLASDEGIYDQILLSKSLLTHDQIVVKEKDVRFFCDGFNSIHRGGRRRIPHRWPTEWVPGSSGVSDHFPICAEIQIS